MMHNMRVACLCGENDVSDSCPTAPSPPKLAPPAIVFEQRGALRRPDGKSEG